MCAFYLSGAYTSNNSKIVLESLMSKFLLWANKIDCENYAITFGNGNAFQITSTEILCY